MGVVNGLLGIRIRLAHLSRSESMRKSTSSFTGGSIGPAGPSSLSEQRPIPFDASSATPSALERERERERERDSARLIFYLRCRTQKCVDRGSRHRGIPGTSEVPYTTDICAMITPSRVLACCLPFGPSALRPFGKRGARRAWTLNSQFEFLSHSLPHLSSPRKRNRERERED